MSGALSVTADELKQRVREGMRKKRLPLPKRSPKGDDPEFLVPRDPNRLGSVELGQWLLRLAGYEAYCARLLGQVESELVLVDAELTLKVNAYAPEVREELGGRPNTEVVEAQVLVKHDELASLYERRLELRAYKAELASRLKIYERSWQSLSRELARREIEVRAASRGGD